MSELSRHFARLSDGRQIHYRSAGSASSPTLVLMHQAPSSSAMYEALMTALTEQFYILAPDMPGFGDSDALAGPIRIEHLAQSCAEWLAMLGQSKVILFGHHTGTSVALAMAVAEPDLIQTLYLCGPAHLSSELAAALPSKAEPYAAAEDGHHLTLNWQRMRAKSQAVPLALSQRETLLALQMGERYQQAYQAVADYDFGSALDSCQSHCVLLAGTEDLLHSSVASSAERLHANPYTIDIEQIEIESAGSYICETHVELIAQLLIEANTPETE